MIYKMRIKQTILIFPLLACLACLGCASTPTYDGIIESYDTVNFDDGISVEEAQIIGQREVVRKAEPEIFNVFEPEVVTEFESVPHNEDYWFVSFAEIEPGFILSVYMVAMSKETGKIVFSNT